MAADTFGRRQQRAVLRDQEDVLAILDAPLLSAAVGAAIELGLFWSLEAKPLDLGPVRLTMTSNSWRSVA